MLNYSIALCGCFARSWRFVSKVVHEHEAVFFGCSCILWAESPSQSFQLENFSRNLGKGAAKEKDYARVQLSAERAALE